MAAAATEIGLRLKEEENRDHGKYRATFCQAFIWWANIDRNLAPDHHLTCFFLLTCFVAFLKGERIRLTQELNLNQPLYGRYV